MGEDHFATTRWTMVMEAGRAGTAEAEKALAGLCGIYWFPLYAYVRRHGRSKEDAEDLTQAFFARLLNQGGLNRLDSSNGRFRAFLLASLKNFLANEWDRAASQKRGGSITHLSLDWESADTRFAIADGAAPSPEVSFDREWALTLLERVVVMLGAEFAAQGKGREFERLKGYLTTAEDDVRYEEIAAQLGIENGAMRVRVHRMRKRYRELLKGEIASTLEDPAMVDEELAVLMRAFG